MTGYEQVRSVAAELTGDHEAAARVELTLPDTGVCGGAGLFDESTENTGGCCGTPAQSSQLASHHNCRPISRRKASGSLSLSR